MKVHGRAPCKEAMADKRVHKRRPAPISYRPPKDREAEFRARVATSELSTNAFITEALFGRNRHRPDELKALARLLASAAQISDRLHEIEITGAGDSTLLIEATHRELAEIRAALLIMMGRQP